jgi:hypothetical protein
MEPTAIFYHIDEFCKFIEQILQRKMLENGSQRRRSCKLTLSEVMTIAVMFHRSGYKNFKSFFLGSQEKLRNYFPNLVSYTRFIELRSAAAMPLLLFLKFVNNGLCTGHSIVDSTLLKTCHTRRESSHKTFKGWARKGKTSTGWFYGFKLHIVINGYGEIISFALTPGNVADNNQQLLLTLFKEIFGDVAGDLGYLINEKKREELRAMDINLITKKKKCMKSKAPMNNDDAALLKKRGIIETIIGVLKGQFSLEHSRHRSRLGFLAHIAATLTAYFFTTKKPQFYDENGLLKLAA